MKETITFIHRGISSIFVIISLLIGIAWLFDCKPTNLSLVWYSLWKVYICSFLINLLFGKKIF